MNLINQKIFDFECDAYHDGEFTRGFCCKVLNLLSNKVE
ncbi:hypothetical protein UCS_02567 [Enterococcus faecalis EnGen0246]|nr:hypothetical protein UMC_02592 [Enterococcus faecalis EnGen0302]EOI99761.1 hypothetical protein UME_02545 [Enterococcus faecalis EnGen0306]EOL60283.1 hypothetical protein UCS_02567 [Enterococcus faecalis EnGen0246]